MNTPAIGIVTRMGQDPQGLGGEAIEPGFFAEKNRPAFCQQSAARNRGVWLSIADFLTRQNLRQVLAARQAAPVGQACAARTGAAWASALPPGNHGENN